MRTVLRKIPVLTNANFSLLKFQQMSRRQFLNRLECRRGIGNISEIHILQQRRLINLGQFRSHRQNRFHLRSEQQSSVVHRIVQRLLSYPIARQQKASGSLVVNRECEHAAQLLNTLRPILFVKMNNRFRIAAGGESMAAGLQLGIQLLKVVDFAVEDDRYSLVFVEDWLVPARNIDDAETPHAQSDAALYKDTFVVWSTVNDGFTHPVNDGAIDRAVRMSLNHSCD